MYYCKMNNNSQITSPINNKCHFFFFFNNFTYLFTFGCAGVSITLCSLSLVAASWGYSSLRCTGLLISEASLTVEPGLQIHGLQ